MKEEKLPYTVLAIIIIIRSIRYSRRLRGVIPTYCKTRGNYVLIFNFSFSS